MEDCEIAVSPDGLVVVSGDGWEKRIRQEMVVYAQLTKDRACWDVRYWLKGAGAIMGQLFSQEAQARAFLGAIMPDGPTKT